MIVLYQCAVLLKDGSREARLVVWSAVFSPFSPSALDLISFLLKGRPTRAMYGFPDPLEFFRFIVCVEWGL